jgi:integrase
MPEEYAIEWHRGKRVIAYRLPTGRRVRRSLGTADVGLAEARAREYWATITAAPTERIRDLWPAYVRDRLKEVKNTKRFRAHWTALEPHFGHRLGTMITADDCRAYHKALKADGKADSTIKTDLEMLRACLNKMLRDRAPEIWLPPSSKPRSSWLTPEDVSKVYADARSLHVALFIELAIATGARMSAVLDLTWDRVDLENGFVDLMPAGRHQTNKQRAVVPLTKRALVALRRAKEGAMTVHVIEWNGKPIKSIKKALERISERTGVDFSAHVLRHTAGVWMAKADVPMQKIAQYLGHTSSKVTERVYARYSPSFMRDAANALEWA